MTFFKQVEKMALVVIYEPLNLTWAAEIPLMKKKSGKLLMEKLEMWLVIRILDTCLMTSQTTGKPICDALYNSFIYTELLRKHQSSSQENH